MNLKGVILNFFLEILFNFMFESIFGNIDSLYFKYTNANKNQLYSRYLISI